VHGDPKRDLVKNWFFAFVVIDTAAIGVLAFVLSQKGFI
jgi:hypothetical protein